MKMAVEYIKNIYKSLRTKFYIRNKTLTF